MWGKLKIRFKGKVEAPPDQLKVGDLLKTRRLDVLVAGMAAEGPEREEYFRAVKQMVEDYHSAPERPKHIAIPQFRWLRGKGAPNLLLDMACDQDLDLEWRRVAFWTLEKIDDRAVWDGVKEFVENGDDDDLRRVAATVLARSIGQKLEQVADNIEQRSPTDVPIAEDGCARLWSDRQCRLLQRDYVQLLKAPLGDEVNATIVLALLNEHSEFGQRPEGSKFLHPELRSAFAELQTPILLRKLLELHEAGDATEQQFAADLLPLVCGGIDLEPAWDEQLVQLPPDTRRTISRLAIISLGALERSYHPLRGLCADVPARAVLQMNIAPDAQEAARCLRRMVAEEAKDTPEEHLADVERLAYLLEVCAEEGEGRDEAPAPTSEAMQGFAA